MSKTVGMSHTPSAFTRHIAGSLRAGRARTQVKASDLAELVDVSTSQLYKMFAGEKPITLDQLLLLCLRLGLDVNTVIREAREAAEAQLEGDLERALA